MKRVPLGITIGLMAIAAAVSFVVTSNYTLDRFNKKISNVNEKQEFYSKISEIDTFVRMNYVTDIDEQKLIESMVGGYMDGIGDGFAEYMTADEYAEYIKSMDGTTQGLGFSYEKEPGGYIRITEVDIGGAAEEAGLIAGDIITAVNNTDVIAFEGGFDEAVSLFKCAEGTRVRLYIKRTTEEEGTNFIDYDVISQVGEHITIKGSLINKTGWIEWLGVNDKTPAQLRRVTDELIAMGAESLIYDVRGLYFREVPILSQCMDQILDRGVVTALYQNGTAEQIICCTEAESIKMPVCVLVNEDTCGLAEIFAASLRDYAGAKVIGAATKGNGRMQMTYMCSDGSVVIFSNAELSTENSGAITGTGIIPDETIALPEGVDLRSSSDVIAEDTQLLHALDIIEQQTKE